MIQAIRGKRLNVLAALISTGKLFNAKLWNTTKSDAFAGFLCLLYKHVGKAFTVILDNATIQKSKEVQPFIKYLEEQGVKFYFLPPYSLELNRIKRLWHKMKYTWIAPSSETLRRWNPILMTYLKTSGLNSNSRFSATRK